MTSNTFKFPRSAFVGFDHIFADLERLTNNHQKDHYPPHNVVKFNDDEYMIELAVVGFKQDDIDIKYHDGILTIKGSRKQRREQDLYMYKGISGREFERSFRLSEFVEVKGAELQDGLLVVNLEKIVPEEKRPRQILINGCQNDNTSTKEQSELLIESN